MHTRETSQNLHEIHARETSKNHHGMHTRETILNLHEMCNQQESPWNPHKKHPLAVCFVVFLLLSMHAWLLWDKIRYNFQLQSVWLWQQRSECDYFLLNVRMWLHALLLSASIMSRKKKLWINTDFLCKIGNTSTQNPNRLSLTLRLCPPCEDTKCVSIF